MCRVLNATALEVAFTLPLVGGLRLHGCHMSLAGRSADVGLGKATVTTVAIMSRRGCTSLGYPRFFVSQARCVSCARGLSQYLCGTVEVCVVFLDTLTPLLELYVRLWERQQWDSDFPEFVLLSLGAPARDSRGARHGPAAVCLQVWCWLVSTVVWLYLVERQLDLSPFPCGGVVLSDSCFACYGCGLTRALPLAMVPVVELEQVHVFTLEAWDASYVVLHRKTDRVEAIGAILHAQLGS
ncbi:hypothetical protein Taro_036921 [Colocasia esculenta]|uniref:Uncharacterized protein n=1 Tax=Colocasia esculenta TaxID=4460 RepID=A0A843W4C7_COLES|nr:hypothetical protein [Colocasia esculenta]